MNSWLDMLPSSERQKIREKYKLSPAAYEKLRQKVKGPEQLGEEMQRNELMAKLKFALETEPKVKEALKQQVEKDFSEQGIEVPEGEFDVTVDSISESEPDQIVLVPEGNVSEKVSVPTSLADTYLSQLKVDK